MVKRKKYFFYLLKKAEKLYIRSNIRSILFSHKNFNLFKTNIIKTYRISYSKEAYEDGILGRNLHKLDPYTGIYVNFLIVCTKTIYGNINKDPFIFTIIKYFRILIK